MSNNTEPSHIRCHCGANYLTTRTTCPTCKEPPRKASRRAREKSESPLEVRISVPPSANDLWEGMGRTRRRSERYELWLMNNEEAVSAFQGLIAPVAAKVTIHDGSGWNPARDLDNVAKPIGDLLVRAGVLPADTAKQHIRGWQLWFEPTSDPNPLPAFVRLSLWEVR